MFCSVKSDASLKKILKFAKGIASSLSHFLLFFNLFSLSHVCLFFLLEKSLNDPVRFPSVTMVIVGLPNVGKSSMLNALRRIGVRGRRVAPVAPFAGVTTSIQNRVRVSEDPPVYITDTPGIFDPHVIDPVQGLKIALTGIQIYISF